MSNIIFVSSPSKGTVVDGKLTEGFLRRVAELQQEHQDKVLISPMILGYAILPYLESQEATWTIWKSYCESLIRSADRMIVIKYPNWEDSEGVRSEIAAAIVLDLEIDYVES